MATGTSEGERLAGEAFMRLQSACEGVIGAAGVVPLVRVMVDNTEGLTEVERQSVTGMCDIVTKAAFDLVRLAKLGTAATEEQRRG